ncbi:MAG TPA: NADH-quinone oxidoreductase subunit J [Aquifex sp.]|uniref:NADH-quinone oxidoreductase subunit J n=1 Tax=Aquifex aeolicus TaxID=63363 RepID=A0A9D1CG08_AQUAO|nr:NADH-quinone oxidoreductase subunit J [Aquifex sp.]HIP98003.1 NADH-quinone oxidoreductase subunit J [Aquifex aeolicus]
MFLYFTILFLIVIATAIAAIELTNFIWVLVAFATLLTEIALFYFSLGFPLLGAFQLAVYAGGVAILVLFTILTIGEREEEKKESKLAAGVAIAIFITGVIASIWTGLNTKPYLNISLQELGKVFIEKYALLVIPLGFTAVGIIFGAYYLLSKKLQGEE